MGMEAGESNLSEEDIQKNPRISTIIPNVSPYLSFSIMALQYKH